MAAPRDGLDPRDEAIAKLRSDVEIWRRGVEKATNDCRKVTAQYVQQSSELVAARDELKKITETLGKMSLERELAIELLSELCHHTAGRNGMLEVSRMFCHKCGNQMPDCPTQRVCEFLDKLTGEEKAA